MKERQDLRELDKEIETEDALSFIALPRHHLWHLHSVSKVDPDQGWHPADIIQSVIIIFWSFVWILQTFKRIDKAQFCIDTEVNFDIFVKPDINIIAYNSVKLQAFG